MHSEAAHLHQCQPFHQNLNWKRIWILNDLIWSRSGCPLDRSQNVVDSFPCRCKSFCQVLWKVAGDCTRDVNKSSTMPYYAVVREVEKWYEICIHNNVGTSYFTQLKMCYLMTTFRCPSDILIMSWLFTAGIGMQNPTNSATHGTRWFSGHVFHQAVNNQNVIKMSDGHWNVVIR